MTQGETAFLEVRAPADGSLIGTVPDLGGQAVRDLLDTVVSNTSERS